MTTEFTKPVSRQMILKDQFGHEGEVVVTLCSWGLEFRKKGTSRRIHATWEEIAKNIKIPPTAPSKHFSNPMGWMIES